MNEKILTLTPADMNAVSLEDSNYINGKGAKLYCGGRYKSAVEYYRLAAAMGNVQAIANLGYCYLYGRDIEPNLSLAIAYFKIASVNDNIDAAYKLGDIYGSDKWGLKDVEMSVYYYRMAASFIIGDDWENATIAFCDSLQKYPSLCYALGREFSVKGNLSTDIEISYQFLKHAEKGYRIELANGNKMFEKSYAGVVELINDCQFDEIREKYDELYREENGLYDEL